MALSVQGKNGVICDKVNCITKVLMVTVFLERKLFVCHKLTALECLQVLLIDQQKSSRNCAFFKKGSTNDLSTALLVSHKYTRMRRQNGCAAPPKNPPPGHPRASQTSSRALPA